MRHKFSILDFQFSIKQKGFTLIELLVVIAIIGTLTTILMGSFIGVRQRARDTQRKSDLRQIKTALELYKGDKGGYPPDASVSQTEYTASGGADWIPGLRPMYMQKLPQGVYYYGVSADRLSYTLWTNLENTADPEIYLKSTANCQNTPPSAGYNYCVKQPN